MQASPPPANSPPVKKLLDQVSDAIHVKHYSSRTEKTYKDWIRRCIFFHNKLQSKDMDAEII